MTPSNKFNEIRSMNKRYLQSDNPVTFAERPSGHNKHDFWFCAGLNWPAASGQRRTIETRSTSGAKFWYLISTRTEATYITIESDQTQQQVHKNGNAIDTTPMAAKWESNAQNRLAYRFMKTETIHSLPIAHFWHESPFSKVPGSHNW